MTEITEHTILLDMKSCANNLLTFQEIKNKQEKIQHNIDNLKNNYFVKNSEIYTKYLDNFSESKNEKSSITNDIFLFIKDLDCAIANLCVHEWIHDSIETGAESSENIVYCYKCELTKR